MPLNESKVTYSEYQRQLANFCRTEDFTELPGATSAERVQTYRNLVFNGIEAALNNAFPLTREILETKWPELIRRFVAEFPCQSPQLWQMPYGLIEYVESRSDLTQQFPFLLDLLNFEWVEIEVYMMEDASVESVTQSGSVLNDVLVLNSEHRILLLEFPVFKFSTSVVKANSEVLVAAKGIYPLICYRHPQTLKANYFQLSTFYLNILGQIQEKQSPGRDAIEFVAKEMGLAASADELAKLLEQGEEFLTELLQQQIIIGFKK